MDPGEPDPDELLELLSVAVATESPAGAEAQLARCVGEWLEDRHPELECRLDQFAQGRANLECRARGDPGDELVLYSHLDTSLSGDARLDRAVGAPVPERLELERRGDVLSGLGVVVAKGPMAAAVIGFALASTSLARRGRSPRATLLLASGGTHRAHPPGLEVTARTPSRGAGDGVRRYLARHRPRAAVVAKAGPPGLLYEEPGFASAVVQLRGRPGLVMSRDESVRNGGVPAAAGPAVCAVERWRTRFISRPSDPASQAGREAAVGALSCGVPYKPDLIGGVLELFVYVVLGAGDDPLEVVTELEAEVASSVREDGFEHLEVGAVVVDAVASARTDPDAAIVHITDEAYREVWGASASRPVGWTGSTDGVLLRRAGVHTVRVGPSPLEAAPGREAISLEGLVSNARLYARIVERFSAV